MKFDAAGNTEKDALYLLSLKRNTMDLTEVVLGEIRVYGDFEHGYKAVQEYEFKEREE